MILLTCIGSDVDILLAAAAGSDPIRGSDLVQGSDSVNDSDPTQSSELNKLCFGEPDEDLLFLIRYAVQMLGNHITTKDHLEERAQAVSGKGRKRSTKGLFAQYSTDKERSAKLALEQLMDGSLMNVNCIISKERAHFIWRLYMQLQYLVTTPHLALPDAIQFLQPGNSMISAQQRRMLLASGQQQPLSATNLPPHKVNSKDVPEPHEFDRRRKKAS